MEGVRDISYGFVPVRSVETGWEFLVVRCRRNRHYFFPKGHKKKFETPIQGAVRELWEESGHVPVLVWDSHIWTENVAAAKEIYREQYLYTRRSGVTVDKTCVYYLAQVQARGSIQDTGEISELQWLPLNEASSSIFTFQTKREDYLNSVLPCLFHACNGPNPPTSAIREIS